MKQWEGGGTDMKRLVGYCNITVGYLSPFAATALGQPRHALRVRSKIGAKGQNTRNVREKPPYRQLLEIILFYLVFFKPTSLQRTAYLSGGGGAFQEKRGFSIL